MTRSAAAARSRPKAHARLLKPRPSWRALALPEDAAAVVSEAGRRTRRTRRLRVLLSGGSAWAAARAIAADQGASLYRIPLSAVVSKYIGETEKNLAAILERAAPGDAVLFFDEADALFGKRTQVRDSHDRYANIEVAYLLKQMEDHQGLVILATNRKVRSGARIAARFDIVANLPSEG